MGKRPTTKQATPAAELPAEKKPTPVKKKRSAIEIVEDLQSRFSSRHNFTDADSAIVTADLAELYELL
jgi:hypothetical protein